jgi:hypothetical protein
MGSISIDFFSSKSIRRLLAILLTLGGLMVALGFSSSSDVSALPGGAAPLPVTGSQHTFTTDNGGSVTVTATFIGPSTPQGSLCDGGRQRPNFSRYISDTGIIVGATSSVLTYDLDFAFRRCGKAIKNYAIYSPVYCEQAGWYGAGAEGKAFDCVKYAAGPPDNVNNPALGCPVNGSTGSGNPCVIQPFFNQIREDSISPYAPPSSLVAKRVDDRTLPIGGSRINGLGLDTRSDGDRDFDATLCQYWKYTDDSAESSDNDGDDDCKRVAFNIRWTYTPPPSYTLSATVSGVDQNFAYTHNLPDPWYWGMRVDAAANLPAEGIGNHNIDIWRIIYPSAPSDGWTEGRITNGENGLCGALSGYINCDRIGAYPCVNAIYGCNTLNAAGQFWRWAFDEELGPYPLGTRVCYISRVSKPTYTSGIDDWKGSIRTCSVSGIKPKVQAWGYDTKATGRIETSLTNVSGRTYGSWGEYGLLSNGTNRNMASGNGLLGGQLFGTTQAGWSPLTFANDAANAFSCSGGFGCYGGVAMPNVGIEGAVDAPGGGDYTVGSYAQLVALVGSKGKLHVNGTLTIAGNLEYPSTVDSISDIPKIQLIANDIVINRNVDRIDPWLIAYRPNTNTYGRISTCDQAGAPGNTFVSMEDVRLFGGPAGICDVPLKFNSPLIADQVFLYRTYDVQDGAVAAETLNVRADNFLSSYVGGGTDQPVATTDSVIELPPRF